ncbi:MAG: hypothetical protein KC457_25370, partial [Myxococcales bacterium]|nr:hypothetical protein [Myxococcales bacterium]
MRTWWRPGAPARSATRRLVNEVAIFATVLALLGLVLWAGWRLLTDPNPKPLRNSLGDTAMLSTDFDERCGEARAKPFIVTVVYGPEKAPWLEPLAGEY